LLGLSRNWTVVAMLLWNLVCITFPLFDMFTGKKDWMRLFPIFAALSTLFTGILSFFPSMKSWIRVVTALMFLFVMAVGILGVIWKWSVVPSEQARYILNFVLIAIVYSVGAASLWRKRGKEETCTGYSLNWATPLTELRLQHKVEGQEEDWQPAQQVKLTEASTGGPATDFPTYIGTTTVPKNVTNIRLEGSTEPVWSLENQRTKRNVKLGKIWLKWWLPCAHHWAVQVDGDGDGGMWYEVGHKEPWFPRPPLKIEKTPDADRKGLGHFEAGCCGGELVGQTEMTDDEIDVFLVNWQNGMDYFVTSENCIKFGYEFIEKLTDGNFSLSPSSLVAKNASDNSPIASTPCIGASGPGYTALARHGAGDNRLACGTACGAGVRARFGPEFKAQVVAGPGLGVFLDASCSRVEFTWGLPCLGVQLHTDINMNTGVGARNGNVELHLLGFGMKVGVDGLEINTPWIGGYNGGAIIVLVFFEVLDWATVGSFTCTWLGLGQTRFCN